MANSAEDYARSVTFLRTLPATVRVALEPTGNFHRTLAFHLITAGISVVSVLSVAGARYREAMFNSRDKNDPKDATVILQLLKHGLVQHYHEPLLAGHHDLQELAKSYGHVALACKRLADSLLNHYLPLHFPEMARYWELTRVEWFVAFLSRFPTPRAVRAPRLHESIEAAWPLIGRKINKRAKLEELYEPAQSSIALPVAVGSPAIDTFRLQPAHFAAAGRAPSRVRSPSPWAAEGPSGLPMPLLLARRRLDPGHGDPRRGRESPTLLSSPAVSEVLRPGPGEVPVGAISRPRDALETRQCPAAHGLLDGGPARRADERELVSRPIRAVHEAGSWQCRHPP